MLVYGTEPTSCFGLMGQGENAATLALAWCFDRSDALRRAFVTALGKPSWPTNAWAVACQAHADDKGFTDIEVQAGSFHLLVEAKAGLMLPNEAQLRRYIARLGARRGQEHLVVTISAASQSWSKSHGVQRVEGVPVRHLAWSDVGSLVREAEQTCRSPIECLWLDELAKHLKGYGMTQNRFDARAYVVSLSNSMIHVGDELTWIDVVTEQGRYFHPYGKGWPKVPPAYLGFRYKAAFRSVHYVAKAEIVDRLDTIDSRWPGGPGPHVVYTLGPTMRPSQPLPLGRIHNSARHEVAIDLLLSGQCATYADAITLTREREGS